MKKRWILAGLLAAAGSVVANLPLSWIPLPPDAGTPSGTVWNGQLSDVPVFGQVGVATKLGAVELATAPGDAALRGTVGPSKAQDLIVSVPLAAVPMNDARLANLGGVINLSISEARYGEEGCESATGRAMTNVLVANARQLGWAGPELAGPVDCVDGRLRVSLSGRNADGEIEAVTTTGVDGTYQTEITARTPDPAAGNALVLYGFSRAGEGEYRLAEQGRWR